jgi:rhamnosyltransferase
MLSGMNTASPNANNSQNGAGQLVLESKDRNAGTRKSSVRVALVIPTLNAGSRWIECLEGIKRQTLLPHRLLNIDSESTDETTARARDAGFEVVCIRRSDFNHGGTRQWAIEYLDDCEIMLFLTQDAVPATVDAFERIVECFSDPRVAVAYGRQIPHAGATLLESHARVFNYGPQSLKKDIASATEIGAKVFFCSNSFAAYSRSVSLQLGGFRRDLILGEDMEFAARAIDAGFINAYCAAAVVRHSHDYRVMQQVGRYFDLGVFDSKVPWMREKFGSHNRQGAKFALSEVNFLFANRGLSAIPRALLQTIAKLVGYRLGRMHEFVPSALKRKLTTVPNYWR